MKEIHGFENLLAERQRLPECGWIFVDEDLDRNSIEALEHAIFYVPENEDDEFYGEDNLAAWLECPIFLGVLDVREGTLVELSSRQAMEAALHYLKFDDFLE
ncbi:MULTISPECIES: hypothetical protein [unclassified Streptomyces]|uniref:hypothetical protein n=1 Tax=unclassified Streptomyces TaxID=2593676 RepID=UPI002E2CBDEB|nr:hypothetical protein [Streptomyces sp. NBC_01429]